MKLESQVCSLELAKRLKELGVEQESYFYWADEELVVKWDEAQGGGLAFEDGKSVYRENYQDGWTQDYEIKEIYSAFTVAELGSILIYCPEWHPTDGGPTEADFRAKLLIEKIEQGLLTLEKGER